MKKIFLTLTILLSISVFAEKVTVQEAVEMAIKNNKDIKISMLEYEQSQLDVNKAWKDAYFKINYTAKQIISLKQSILLDRVMIKCIVRMSR